MKKILILFVCLCMVSCGSPSVKTQKEKIGNLTIDAPAGWKKSIDDSGDFYKTYSYTKSVKNTLEAAVYIYVDKDTKEKISISDFDYLFEDSNDGVEIKFDETNDSFLGDKPIRKGYGTIRFNGDDAFLYDNLVAAMYDADNRMIHVEYMFLDSLSDKGYLDYGKKLFNGMILTYAYQ